VPTSPRTGPLTGLRVLEFAGIGPGPMTAMLLADLGAEVLRIDRLSPADTGLRRAPKFDLVLRNRRSAAIDIKHPDGRTLALDLIGHADAIIEGFRPGAMERLGLGPEPCLARNPRLVYGRITGYGQHGPMAQAAGHDLNYIGLTGTLHAIGRQGAPPTPPLNLAGDYSGALYLAFGMLAALLEAAHSGQGQVVDTAMIDSAAGQMTAQFGLRAAGLHNGPRGTNILDSGAPFYDVYECADGGFLAIAPIEARFRAPLLAALGFGTDFPDMDDEAQWPAARALLAARLREHPRDAWAIALADVEGCATPVLSPAQAPLHPHNQARGTFVTVDGIAQPAPAPRFSRTPASTPTPPEPPGASTGAALRDWGIAPERIAALRDAGVILVSSKGCAT